MLKNKNTLYIPIHYIKFLNQKKQSLNTNGFLQHTYNNRKHYNVTSGGEITLMIPYDNAPRPCFYILFVYLKKWAYIKKHK